MISLPEDYRLNEQQTLAFSHDAPPPVNFDLFWRQWREANGRLPTRIQGDVRTECGEIIYESARNVRVAGRLTRPPGVIRGAVLALHGSDTPDGFSDDEELWTNHGLATLRIRVRGFPPSTLDIDDLRGQWILHNIADADAWILNGAVADVVQGVRVLREIFSPTIHIALYGESFGGGLAVFAAAQLQQLNQPIKRLILGLPTFGAWQWRNGRYCNGTGGQVNMMLDALRGSAQQELLETLEFFDTVHHARQITAPVLCKLACRDDVVPAPSAAAVFTALASPVKQRFVTQYGHFDGGIANARRHALFEKLHPAFADPLQSPERVITEAESKLNNPTHEAHKYL